MPCSPLRRPARAMTAAAVAPVIAAADPLAGDGSASASVSNHSPTVSSRNDRPMGRHSDGLFGGEPAPKRFGDRRIGLDALGLESGFEIREETRAVGSVLLGATKEVIEPDPSERQLLRCTNPALRCRRKHGKEFGEPSLVVAAHGSLDGARRRFLPFEMIAEP